MCCVLSMGVKNRLRNFPPLRNNPVCNPELGSSGTLSVSICLPHVQYCYHAVWCVYLQERAINEIKDLQNPERVKRNPQPTPPRIRKKKKTSGKRRRSGMSKWERLIVKAYTEAKNSDNVEHTSTSTGWAIIAVHSIPCTIMYNTSQSWWLVLGESVVNLKSCLNLSERNFVLLHVHLQFQNDDHHYNDIITGSKDHFSTWRLHYYAVTLVSHLACNAMSFFWQIITSRAYIIYMHDVVAYKDCSSVGVNSLK